MILFLFALAIVIITGIPFIKSSIENKKKFKEYVDEGNLGKNEALGKIKDEKTFNEKIIENLFYFSLVALIGSGFYNFYMFDKNNSSGKYESKKEDEISVSSPSSNSSGTSDIVAEITTKPVQAETPSENAVSEETLKIQENVKKEQDRLKKMFDESEKNTKPLIDTFMKNVNDKDAKSGIQNGEKALENVKKSNELFKNAKCTKTGDSSFDSECPKILDEGRKLYASKQELVEKTLEILKDIEKGVQEAQSSEVGQEIIKKGNELWNELLKKSEDFLKNSKK